MLAHKKKGIAGKKKRPGNDNCTSAPNELTGHMSIRSTPLICNIGHLFFLSPSNSYSPMVIRRHWTRESPPCYGYMTRGWVSSSRLHASDQSHPGQDTWGVRSSMTQQVRCMHHNIVVRQSCRASLPNPTSLGTAGPWPHHCVTLLGVMYASFCAVGKGDYAGTKSRYVEHVLVQRTQAAYVYRCNAYYKCYLYTQHSLRGPFSSDMLTGRWNLFDTVHSWLNICWCNQHI